jgi:hypothetical protein
VSVCSVPSYSISVALMEIYFASEHNGGVTGVNLCVDVGVNFSCIFGKML